MTTPATTANAVPTIHLQNILVPVDFSNSSQKALTYAVAFARQFGAKLWVLHVVEIPYLGGYGEMETPPLQDDLETAARENIAQLVQTHVAGAVPATTQVRLGQPWYEITQTAQETGADLIIVATHGYTGLKHILLGSTAERVVRHAFCPVLVMREREREFVATPAAPTDNPPAPPAG